MTVSGIVTPVSERLRRGKYAVSQTTCRNRAVVHAVPALDSCMTVSRPPCRRVAVCTIFSWGPHGLRNQCTPWGTPNGRRTNPRGLGVGKCASGSSGHPCAVALYYIFALRYRWISCCLARSEMGRVNMRESRCVLLLKFQWKAWWIFTIGGIDADNCKQCIHKVVSCWNFSNCKDFKRFLYFPGKLLPNLVPCIRAYRACEISDRGRDCHSCEWTVKTGEGHPRRSLGWHPQPNHASGTVPSLSGTEWTSLRYRTFQEIGGEGALARASSTYLCRHIVPASWRAW